MVLLFKKNILGLLFIVTASLYGSDQIDCDEKIAKLRIEAFSLPLYESNVLKGLSATSSVVVGYYLAKGIQPELKNYATALCALSLVGFVYGLKEESSFYLAFGKKYGTFPSDSDASIQMSNAAFNGFATGVLGAAGLTVLGGLSK